VLLFAVKYKFMALWLNTLIPLLYLYSSIQSSTFYKSLTNCKDIPRSLNGDSGRALLLVYKFDNYNCEVQQFSDEDP